MKTTLNLPDPVVYQAKRRALEEGTTLTDLIIQGLKARLERAREYGPLPVSGVSGGLCQGVTWEALEAAEGSGETYR